MRFSTEDEAIDEARLHHPETGARSVEANGLTFHYFEEGEGPLVLLMHGFPDTAHTWDAARRALAREGYRAVSPFMRGYAPTEAPAGVPSFEDFGRDILALIEALGEEKAALIGHDWGAMACYAATLLEPSKVTKLVTVGVRPLWLPNAFTPEVLYQIRHMPRLASPGGQELLTQDDFAYVNELYARWSPNWQVTEAELAPVKNCFADPASAAYAVSYYRSPSFRPPFVIPPGMREAVEVETLLVTGNVGLSNPPAYSQERLAPAFTGEFQTLIVDGAGHFPHREAPARFEAALLDFLRG